MQEEKIARRYARALLLEVDDDAALLQIESDFIQFSQFFRLNHLDFLQLISNPVFDKEERKRVMCSLGEQFSWQSLTRKLVTLLVEKDRMLYIPAIAAELSREVDNRLGRVRATIVTMNVLSQQELSKVVNALQVRIGKSVIAKNQVDNRIFGGVRAHIGGLVFDHTLETQIDSLEKTLLSPSLSV